MSASTRPVRISSPRYVLPVLIAIAVIWGVAINALVEVRRLTVESRERQLARLSSVFEQHLVEVLNHADSIVRAVRYVYSQESSIVDVEEYLDAVPLNPRLLSHVTVISRDGVPIFNSRSGVRPGVSAADRPYFRWQARRDDDSAYISLPHRGRNSGRHVVRLVRRMVDADGAFAGVAFVAIEAEQLVAMLGDLDLPAESLGLVVGDDGALRGCFPEFPGKEQWDVSETALWRDAKAMPDGVLVEGMIVDGIPRQFATVSIDGFPVTALIGFSREQLAARLWSRQAVIIGAALLLTFIAVVLAGIIRAQLRAGEARLQAIFATAAEGIITFGADGRITSLNAAALKMFGGREAELLGLPVNGFFRPPPGNANGGAQSGGTALKALAGMRAELEIQRDGCEPLPVVVAVTVVPRRRRPFYVGLLTDISENKRAERLLAESRQRFRDFGEIASDWFWEMDEDLCFSYFSEQFEVNSGIPPSELLGRTREEMGIPGMDLDVWHRHLDDLRNHRAFREFEHPGTHPDGKVVWLSISGRPVFDNAGDFRGYRGVGANVTARVETERALVDAKDAAEAANKAKSAFLSAMSHELRTPMNAILGFAQLLELDTDNPLNEIQAQSVWQIKTSGKHLLELISQVLDLERIDAGKMTVTPVPLDPASALSDCLEMARALGQQDGIAIIDESEFSTLPPVFADATRLKQVLLNLLSNAVKYNVAGGTVTIRTIPEDGGVPPGMLRFEIEDTGAGIAPEHRDRVFQPFERVGETATQTDGAGIGLAISKNLVELMDGEIGFHSNLGKGSTFWFRVPLAPEDARRLSVTQLATVSRKPTRAGKAILYFEDNPLNAHLMKTVLAGLKSVELVVVPDAESCLADVELVAPDLIMMDLHLPGISGIEATSMIRDDDRFSDIPIVAVTAVAKEEAILAGKDPGFAHYITKPIAVSETVSYVRGVLGLDGT